MKTDLKPTVAAMAAIVSDPRAARIEKILAAQIILSAHGCLLPEINEQWLSVRQITQLRSVKQQIVGSVLKRKERRKKQNRRTYLRRRIKQLEETQNEQS